MAFRALFLIFILVWVGIGIYLDWRYASRIAEKRGDEWSRHTNGFWGLLGPLLLIRYAINAIKGLDEKK